MGFDRPRSGGFGRDRDGGGRGGFGGRGGGFGGRGGGGFRRERGPVEMHDAVCDKCKKECQVPFKPSEGKPVLCSECFSNAGGSRRDMNSSSGSGGGMSQDQFKQLNTKLDKILKILDEMEIVDEDDDGEDLVEDDEDEDDVVSDKDEAAKPDKGLVENSEDSDEDEDEDEDKEDSDDLEDEKVVI